MLKRFFNSIKEHDIVTFLGLLVLLNNFVNCIHFAKENSNKLKSIEKRSIFYNVDRKPNKTKENVSKNNIKFSCKYKEDEAYYEHHDCHKYWHCLYVGTIFENALERKCPIGTMFHPIQRTCEISTMVILKIN